MTSRGPRWRTGGCTSSSASDSFADRVSPASASRSSATSTELKKPDAQRLPGYHESQLQSLLFSLLSPAPVYPELEEALLADALQESLEELGADDPFVKAVLAGRSPKDAAAALIGGTKLADPAVRKQLVDGGEAAVTASTDPLIVAGRALDPILRDITNSD